MIERDTKLQITDEPAIAYSTCYRLPFIHRIINLKTKKMGLDFSHTCPKIDKAISEAKDTIIDYLKDYITDLCPYISDEKANELSKDLGTDLYDKISDGFEATRETNEDMRKQADYQIERLESEIEDLKSEIKELESQLDAAS